MIAAELTELKDQKQRRLIIIFKGILAAQCLTGIYGTETDNALIYAIKTIQIQLDCKMIDRNSWK